MLLHLAQRTTQAHVNVAEDLGVLLDGHLVEFLESLERSVHSRIAGRLNGHSDGQSLLDGILVRRHHLGALVARGLLARLLARLLS
ncbi:MAG: hypothetical protein ACO3HV_12440, partial [Candidatus Nanopelagicales bacterium]